MSIPVKAAMFAEQRTRLSQALAGRLGDAAGVFALWKGASEVPRNAQDTNFAFRQDSYFYHLFGFETPDCYGALDVASGKGYIFIPRLPQDYAVWMGPLPLPGDVKAKTEVDDVFFVDEIPSIFKNNFAAKTVLVLNGANTDSGISVATAETDKIEGVKVDNSSLLFDTHNDIRLKKTALEIELLAQINTISSKAHTTVLQQCHKPGMNERHLEATFRYSVYMNGGCRELAYGPICAAGQGGAILHYIDNDKDMKEGDMVLMDMGGEYHCYASDITTCFQIGGKFTPVGASIYNGVLAAHDAVIAAMKPGVKWPDMQRLALRVMSRTLVELDIIRGATEDEIEQMELMAKFMPHGLGHMIGIDVHDVGGYGGGAPERETSKLTQKLRTARVLEEGHFITVEPGMYFNAVLLEAAFKDPVLSKHLNEEKIRQPEFWTFGGVRLESNVFVTATGTRNLTNVPRKVEDVEAVAAGKQWF